MEIKTVNRNRIYRMIYQNPRISRPELCHRLGLSMPTVMQNVRYLQDRGLVEEGGSLDSTGGRKAVALTCVKDARTAVGLDLTANHISGVLVDLEGGILAESREKRAFAVSGEYADALAGVVRDLIGKAAAPAERVLGVGVSMPGTFSADGGLMLDSRVLRMQNLRCAELSKSISLPCVFCNDANAAGFAEVWDVQSPSDALYLSLSNTVGGAILLGGQLYKGENQRGGEFGHIPVVRDGKRCYCGKKGCLDAYCSATVLSDLAGGSRPQFVRELRAGAPTARIAWADYLDNLAAGVDILRMAFDCPVILGGYVGAYMEDQLEELRGRLAYLNRFDRDGGYVRVCRYRTEASAVGAALIHVQAFVNSI